MKRILPILVACFALLALSACRERRNIRGAASSGGEARGTVVPGRMDGATPRAQLDSYDRSMRQVGFAPVGPALTATLNENAIMPYSIEVRRGYCYAISVFGAANTDVNLAILSPIGSTIAQDARDDSHPWVSFCATRPGRLTARVHMASGSGEYYLSVYATSGRGTVDLSSFFGETPTQALAQITVDPATQQRVAQNDQDFARNGYQRVGDPVGVALNEREERRFQVQLERGRCYAFGVLAGEGAADTDVDLIDGSGQSLAVGRGPEQDSQLEYCAGQSLNGVLVVRLYRGRGNVFTTAYRSNQQQAVAAAEDDEPEAPAAVLSQQAAAGASLRENFQLLNGDLQARGYAAFGSPQETELNEGATRDFTVDLEADKCYAMLGTGDSGVRNLDLVLLNPAGQELDHDDAPDSRPTVRICTQAAGRFTVRVRMVSGQGHFMYAAYRWPRDVQGPFGLRGLTYVRLSEVTQLLSVEGFTPDPGYDLERGRLAREGASGTHTIRLSRNICYAVVAVGGDGVRALNIQLGRNNQVLASNNGRSAFPSVRHCTQGSDESLRLTVNASDGSGEYLYQVFSQTPQ